MNYLWGYAILGGFILTIGLRNLIKYLRRRRDE